MPTDLNETTAEMTNAGAVPMHHDDDEIMSMLLELDAVMARAPRTIDPQRLIRQLANDLAELVPACIAGAQLSDSAEFGELVSVLDGRAQVWQENLLPGVDAE